MKRPFWIERPNGMNYPEDPAQRWSLREWRIWEAMQQIDDRPILEEKFHSAKEWERFADGTDSEAGPIPLSERLRQI